MAATAADGAFAKTPGKSYCFYGKCHRVKTIKETEALIGKTQTVFASHYDSCKRDRYNPCGLTSSGAVFESEKPDNAASPHLPDGTTVLVRSPATGVALVMRINNAGPYWGNRTLDVSRKAAEVLGFAGQGVAKLELRVIDAPTVAEATYKRRRVYDPVPGYVGEFASLDDAQSGASRAYQVAGLASPFPADAVLAGNPIQVAGSAGTQGGVTPVAPTVLAAVSGAPAAALTPVAAFASPAAPVKVAALVETAEVAAVPETPAPVKARSYRERTAARNSRSYRKAAQKKAVRNTSVAERKPPQGNKAPRIVTLDGTNDMSVFSRHVYAGMDRIAAQDPRRRPAYNGG